MDTKSHGCSVANVNVTGWSSGQPTINKEIKPFNAKVFLNLKTRFCNTFKQG